MVASILEHEYRDLVSSILEWSSIEYDAKSCQAITSMVNSTDVRLKCLKS